MQRFGLIYTQSWYITLPVWQKELVRTSLELFSREERMKSTFNDYSFIVFPIAKAYEGFLKDFLLQLGLINHKTYLDHRFRIGRALNPDMNPTRRDDLWLYDDVSRMCGGQLGRMLWDTWILCRNQVFHYFPENEKRLTLDGAAKYIEMMAQTIESAQRCEIKH